MANQINNLHELSKDLLSVYSDLKEGKIKLQLANTLAKVADKTVNTTKVILEYNSVKTTIDKIELLEA